jgi:hypothetical protein
MSGGIQDDLRLFTKALLERRGALVEWPTAQEDGTALAPPEIAQSLNAQDDMIRLSCEPSGPGLCANLATDFLDIAGKLLEAEPRIGSFRLHDLYLKRDKLDDAVSRAFTWLNAKVKLGEAASVEVEYHTWWLHASMASEDRWETRLPVTINASSGAEVELPDPLSLWELQPHPDAPTSAPATYGQAVLAAQSRVRSLAADFISRMDSRLERDRKRLREYYNALFREAQHKRTREDAQPDPEQLEAKRRAVQLELRRKLSELDERYSIEAVLRPIVVIRTEIPSVALELSVFRKRSMKKHTAYWNPLLKRFEPLRCSQCGFGAYCLAFTNEDVEPLCPQCAK